MNLGELIVKLSLDSTQFAQELDKVKQNSVASIKKLEKSLDKGFNLKINTSSLDKLNKSLENTLNKYNTINQYFKANPIVVSVDKTQVDDLSKTLTNIKRKVNTKTELSSASKKESVKVGEDVADGFVKGAETIKTKKTKVVNEFKEIINDIKDVFSISSPSKVMEAIGLDLGKGFENGVIASMLLASKRISDAYEKTLDKIIKSPKATQTQKQSAKNLQGEVQRELELYAKLMREDRMPFPEEQKQAAKDILDKAQQNAKKAGLKTEEIRALAQAAKKEADAIISPPKNAGNVANFEEFKQEFLIIYNDLMQQNAGEDKIYKIRREMESKGKVSDKDSFNEYFRDLLNDEELGLSIYNGSIQGDFALNPKDRFKDIFKYDKVEYEKALDDSYHFGDERRTRIQGFNPDFDLEAYIAKIQSTSPVIPAPSPQSVKKEPVEKESVNKEPVQKEVVQKKSVKKKPVVPDIVQELPKIAEESIAVVIEQAQTANRTIDDIFKDIATISKDAVTILQKYGTDISAIPSRNTKQIKEVSKTELSGFIKELESMGFEVVKTAKSKAKTTKQSDTPKPVIPEQNDVIEQAQTANRTIETIFSDIAAISKDAVTILQKYGADISAIPSRNTKQIKEVSKTELSGLVQELQSMGFEVVKTAKSKAKTTKQSDTPKPVIPEQNDVIEQAQTANRTIDDIFKDIATISKDAVTILQKYGADISAIPSRNTKQIKEVSKTELSGFIKELESMGFEVVKTAKSKAKTTKSKTKTADAAPGNINPIEENVSDGLNKEFKDMGANAVDAFASGVEQQSKSSSGRVKKVFNDVVADVKDTLQIQSPSKIMEWIGLNFGKGFESGAIASLALSSSRISDAYKDIVEKMVNDPSVSQSRKQALQATKDEIDKDLQQFAEDYSKGKFASEADAMQQIQQIYSRAQGHAAGVSAYQQIDVSSIYQDASNDVQESQEDNYVKILSNLFDSFANQDLRRFVMNLEKAFEPFQDFITFDIGNLFEYFQGMVDSAIQSLQQLTDVMVQVESTQRKMDYLGGSKSGGANEMKFALATANEFRVPAEAAADAYAQLSLAAKDTKLEGKGVQNLFKGISASISALGLSSMDAEGAFMAYTQMLSKGKISMEELRQQLSERFPPAMGIFSKALNVTTTELNDLASKGALLSDVTLSKVADTLLAEYGSAGKGMKGVGMSLTALGNSMYTIAVKATDAFSGLFSSVIDIFGGIVKSIENSFDSIIKIVGLAGAAMAFALSGTLLGVLSKIPALTVALTSFIGLIKTTFVSGLGIIIAGIPGILAVFLDGFLSAENSITNTLTRAAKNFLGFIFQMVDSIKRNLTGSGLFEVNIGQQKSNPFQGIIDGATKLFNMIPKGVIQMVALVAAFHQLRALGMRAGIFDAISTGFTAIKSIAPAVFASISAGFAGLKAGAISVGATIKASLGGALKTLGALAVQMVLALGVMALAKSDFSNPMQDAVDTMATNINTSLSTIEQSFKNIQESVNNTTQSTSNLASGVKSVVDSIPSKGLQLDILYILGVKSKGYTTDDQIKDINKALANQNPEGLGARENAAYNMQMAKLSVEARAKNIAELRRQQNEARNKGDNQLVDNLEKRIKNNYSFSPFTNNAIDKYLNNPASMQSQAFRDKIAKEERDRLKQLGLSQDQINARNKFFKGTDIVRGTDSQVTEGAKQVLSSTAAFSKRLEELKNSIKTSGLDSSANYLKTGAGATKQRIDEIKKIDQQIAGLGMRRVEAVKSGDLAKLTEIDKQIRNLQRQRETKSQDFKDQLSAAQAISKEADAFAQKLEELGIPIAGELRKAIDEMKALGKQAEETIKKSVPINVMDDLYQKTKTSLDDFQSAFDKFSNNIEIGSAQRTQSIYTPGATQGDTNLLSQQSDIVALQQQVLANRSKLNISSQALTLMSAIPSQTSDQAAEVEELQGVVREDALNLATNEAALQKAKYDIQQTIKDFNDQIEDYVKNITAEIKTIELDTKKANLQMQQQKFSANFRSALFNIIDTELTSLSNAFEKFITSLNDAAMSRLDEEQIGIDLQNKLNSLDDGYENLIENMPTGRQLQGLEQARIDTLKMLSVYDESNSKIQETIRGAETQAASLNKQVNNTVSNTAKIGPNIDKATSSTAQFTEELKRAADTAEQLALSTNQLANSNSGIYSNAMSAGTNTQVSSTATANTGSQNQSRQSTQPPTTRSNFIQQGINNLNNVLTGFGLRPVNPQQPVRPPSSAAGVGTVISNVYGTGVNTGAASAATETQKQAETQRSSAKILALQQTRVTNLIKGINDFILEMEKAQRSSSTDDLSRLDSFYQIMREVNQDVKITNNTRDQVNPLSRIAQNARKTVNGYIQTEKRLLEERSDISLQLSDKEGGILSQFNKLKTIIDTEISKTQDPKLKKQLEEAKGRAQTALDAATASAKDRRAEIDQQLAKMAGAGLTTRKRDKQGNVTGIEPTQKLINLFKNIINIENELQEKQDKIEEYSNDISYVEKLIEGYDLKLQLHPGIVLSESDRKKIVEQKILLLSTQNEQQYLQKQISIGQQFQEDRDLIKYNQRLQLAKTEFEEAKKNIAIQQDIITRDLDKQAKDLKKAAQILNEDLDTTGTYARKRLDIRRNLNDLLETINNTQFDSDPTKNAEMQSQANEKALQRALRQTQELDKEIKDNLLNRNPLLEMEIQRLQRGNADPFVVNRMQRDLATSKWQEEYSTRRDDINEDQGLSPEEKTQAISILDGINAAKLREIADSFKTFGQALADSAISTGLQSLKDGLADLITNDLIIGFDGATGKTRDLSNELRGFERVIYNVSKAVLNAMTKILVDAAVNKLFGKDGLLDIGKIFGAAKGGIVPNYAEGGSVGEIGKAMQRERSQNGGKQPVLAVLTPGERVLTVSENKRFEALQLERFLQPSAVMPEEIAYRKINNYAFGGVVGMNPVPMGSYAQGQSDNSTTINIPVTVENNGNSNDSQLDANSLQNVVRSAVLTEIQRQQRQGGILRR